MALSRATNAVEWAIGHNENAITEQDVSNPDRNAERYGDPNENMKALVWMGKNSVKIGALFRIVVALRWCDFN